MRKIEVINVAALLTVKAYMEIHSKSLSEMAALLGVLPNNMNNYIRSNKTKDFDVSMRAQKLGIDLEFMGKAEKRKRGNQEKENTVLKDWQIDVLKKTGVTIVKKLFTKHEIEQAAKKLNLNVEISDLNINGDCPCYLVRVTKTTKGFV